MLSSSRLTTAEILAVFAEEIAERGGEVTDTFDDGRRLFTRSVLPHLAEARPGDQLQGGVALKATAQEVCVYPYIFRQVCQNGAIVAETLGSRSVSDPQALEEDLALYSIREGIAACCDREVFAANVRRIRKSCAVEADLALNLLPLFSRLSTQKNDELLSQIMDQFFREGDQSRFGLANAVTATARDTEDPDLRWDLEEFGGGVAVGKVPSQPTGGRRGAAARPEQRRSPRRSLVAH